MLNKSFLFLVLVVYASSLALCFEKQSERRHGLADVFSSAPLPTADILEWTQWEIGAFFSFNMITMLTDVPTSYLCGDNFKLPDPNVFNPEALNLDNWMASVKALGAKYAVLTAKHCSGFTMWPTDIFDETGFEYTYSTKFSSFRGGGYDVVQDFVDSCSRYGIKPGLYYSVGQNYFLNAGGGIIQNTTLGPGQAKVSQELYGKIVLRDSI